MEDLEVWKEIPGYEGHYMASTHGRIKSIKNGIDRIRKPVYNSRYYNVCLCMGGINQYRVHRLVAATFLGISLKKKAFGKDSIVVCHIDDDISNNHLSNLTIGTPLSNMQDKCKKGRHVAYVRKIAQLSKKGEVIKEWNSITEAGKELGIMISHISECCRGKLQHTGGFCWSYIN